MASAHIAEIAHPRYRAVCQGCFYAIYFVGSFFAGWVGFGCAFWDSDWSWRVLVLFQCLGCLPLLAVSWTPWMPESPRWLVKAGRQPDALRILAELHANGDQNDELVVNEMAEIVAAVDLDANMIQGRFRDFLKTPGNRLRLYIIIYFAWCLSMSGVSRGVR